MRGREVQKYWAGGPGDKRKGGVRETMITAVSMNPSIDKSLTIERFQYGSMNRVMSSRRDAGGKAINMSVVASTLGLQVKCVGFLWRENGRFIENRLLENGVESEFLWLDGAVRTNLKVLDAEQGVVTEINEPGGQVSEEDLEKLTGLVCAQAEDSDFLVLTGSLPPGCPKDFYARLIRAVEGLPCKCVLDAEGEALHLGLQARPNLIKPNRMELEMAVGRRLDSRSDVVKAAAELARSGIDWVAVSLGGAGALLTDGEKTLFAPALKVPVNSTVGAGDSMVAGMLSGLLAEAPMEEVLRRGVACAAASVMAEGTRLTDKATYKSLLGQIKIEGV